MARLIETRLHDRVVAGVEVEVDQIARGGGQGVGLEVKAVAADFDVESAGRGTPVVGVADEEDVEELSSA